MAKQQTQIKTEIISSDDPDIDCFGNFSSKEKICTKECGLSKECSSVTKSLADDKNKLYQIKSSLDVDVILSKDKLSNNKSVVHLKKKLEEKHTEVKKQMAKDSDKKIVKKKSSKSDKEEIKNIVKAPKKASDPDKKKASKPKKSSFETVHNSVIPVGFESIYKFAKNIEGAELVKKSSVTNVKMSNGIAFCFTKTGTTDSKLSVYVNRSAGYEGFKKASDSEMVHQHNKGDFIIVIKKNDASKQEAIKLLSKWVKDRESFLASQKSSGKKKTSSKKEKAGKSEEKTKKSSKKPDSDSDKATKSKPEKVKAGKAKAEKSPEKSSDDKATKKKVAPDVKPSKKPKFEDEEG